jgi:hypothetical protein
VRNAPSFSHFFQGRTLSCAFMEECQMQIDRLIPLREAITMAGMRTTKAYQEIAAGRLVVVRNGRRTFVRMTELQRYIDSLERDGSSLNRLRIPKSEGI